jgi:hypothetical protein
MAESSLPTPAVLRERLRLRHAPWEFRDLALAHRFAGRCEKPHHVVLGQFPQIWVACPADAERMVKAGYELA